ncbi:uncharacterized protein LOC122138310 [Cyprinus carpio]|uniref:Uncharacterized protein LOC122138310 n=1 Tax=Cyprinus carpio TaxID=7962 RepID=A0A9R0A770_CYPCA|nr:uncharacterized protein LOC122138310 [Cyprinus carpio]
MEGDRKSETEKMLKSSSVVTRSTASSKRSSRTSASMAAAKARARAEAERTRAYYVKKETEMKVEKVRMEGSLTALEHEKEAAAAMAEARILEEAVESMEEGSYRSHSPIAPAADPVQRTSDYVEQHTNNSIVVPPEEISLATPPVDFMNLYGSENKQLKESSHRSVPPDFVEQVTIQSQSLTLTIFKSLSLPRTVQLITGPLHRLSIPAFLCSHLPTEKLK